MTDPTPRRRTPVRIAPNDRGGYLIEVDGHDISHLATTAGITLVPHTQPRVYLTIRDAVEVLLPEALAAIDREETGPERYSPSRLRASRRSPRPMPWLRRRGCTHA